MEGREECIGGEGRKRNMVRGRKVGKREEGKKGEGEERGEDGKKW